MKFKVKILVIVYFAILANEAYAQQNNIKNGAYRNSVDYKNNNPFIESEFIFENKNDLKVPELYYIRAKDSKIKRKTMNLYIWGIYNNGNLFLNAIRLGMANGYIKIEKTEKYSYFKGLPIMSLSQEERLMENSFYFGMTGAIITNAAIKNENRNNIHYFLVLETGMINLLTKENLLRLIEPYPKLISQFQNESEQENIDILRDYLNLVNELSD